MLLLESPCRALVCARCASVYPNCFPFPPVPCLPQRAILGQTETLIIFLFSRAWGGFYGHRRSRHAPRSHHLPLALLGANLAPNCSQNITSSAAHALHSYRRTSTGRSRTAARAGKIVAASEIAMATVVIHRPSKTLG